MNSREKSISFEGDQSIDLFVRTLLYIAAHHSSSATLFMLASENARIKAASALPHSLTRRKNRRNSSFKVLSVEEIGKFDRLMKGTCAHTIMYWKRCISYLIQGVVILHWYSFKRILRVFTNSRRHQGWYINYYTENTCHSIIGISISLNTDIRILHREHMPSNPKDANFLKHSFKDPPDLPS